MGGRGVKASNFIKLLFGSGVVPFISNESIYYV